MPVQKLPNSANKEFKIKIRKSFLGLLKKTLKEYLRKLNRIQRFIAVGILFLILILAINHQNQSLTDTLTELLGLSNDWELLDNRERQAGEVFESRIVRVVDGDTAVLEDETRIRYLNIDTPETKKPNSPIECLGPQSSAFNKALVLNQRVWLEYDKQDKDRYDRDLVFVYLKKEDIGNIQKTVNAKILANGLARVLIIDPNNTYEREFYEIQNQAKTQGLGIWGSC